eukprot:scaffold55699_cov18-Tisochrysis_lutea.AAC.1
MELHDLPRVSQIPRAPQCPCSSCLPTQLSILHCGLPQDFPDFKSTIASLELFFANLALNPPKRPAPPSPVPAAPGLTRQPRCFLAVAIAALCCVYTAVAIAALCCGVNAVAAAALCYGVNAIAMAACCFVGNAVAIAALCYAVMAGRDAPEVPDDEDFEEGGAGAGAGAAPAGTFGESDWLH